MFGLVCSIEEMREFSAQKMRGNQELEQETGAIRAEVSEHRREGWSGLWDQCTLDYHCPEQSTVKNHEMRTRGRWRDEHQIRSYWGQQGI